jgi:eukaryotic-like serine/threonine-protein kinase
MTASAPATVLSGRYIVYGEIASGGMATVQYGRLLGPVGFARAVAIKRLHPQLARDPEFVAMFIDEARICARLSHANLVPTLDVLEEPGELSLVMEYVHGAALDTLLGLARARCEPVPLRVAVALMLGVLHGLHAAHEARSEHGEPLSIVHRDVSPQNIIVAADGIPRVLDFGIAKARVRLRTTPSGEIKGKLSYMAPEQLSGGTIDRRIDVYSAAAVLWEVLVGRTLFDGPSESAIVHEVLYAVAPAPSSERSDVPAALDELVLRGLSRDPARRFTSAREMAAALERALPAASQSEVHDWLESLAADLLAARTQLLYQMQQRAEEQLERSSVPSDGTRRLPVAAPGRSHGEDQAPPLARPVTRVRARSPWRREALAALLLGVLLAVALYGQDGARKEAESVPQPIPTVITSPATVPSAPAVEPTRSAIVAPEPPIREADAAELSPHAATTADPGESAAVSDAGAAPRPRVGAKSARKRRGAGASTPPATPGAHTSKDCAEPFVIDPRGVKRWKPECL